MLASLALVVYTAIVLAIFKIGIPGSGPVTLTLAGIAAFVLSVGMAVDANILIFERTKEELRNGRSLIPSVEAGFDARLVVDPRQQRLDADHVRASCTGWATRSLRA